MVLFLKIALAIALIGYVAWYLEPASLIVAAGQVGGGRLLVGGLLALVGLGVQWIKWQRVVWTKMPEASWVEGLYSLLGGAALGLVTPGRIGEVGRGVFLGRERASMTVLAGVDKLSSAVVTLGLGGIGAWMLWPGLRGWLLLGALLLVAGLWLCWRWGHEQFNAVRNITGWGSLLGLSLVFNLVFMLQFYWFFAIGSSPSGVVVMAIPVVFALKTLLPFAFMDLGIREAAAVLVFSALGLAAQPAFVASLLIFACNVLLPAGIGWLWVGGRNTGVGKRFAMMRKVAL